MAELCSPALPSSDLPSPPDQVDLDGQGFLEQSLQNIYERERGRQSVSEGGAEREREGDTESEAGPRLSAVSPEPDTDLELRNREITT